MPPLGAASSWVPEAGLESIPLLDDATSNDLLLVFIHTLDNEEVLLSLVPSSERVLEPVVSYALQDMPQSRRTRLIVEASSLYFVIMEDSWVFLGWHGEREIWAAFVAMTFEASPQPLVKLTPTQLKELAKTGQVISEGSDIKREPELARPGNRYSVPEWLYELVERVGFTQK